MRIEYRWAAGNYGRLPVMAAGLVKLPIDVLATFGTVAARVAKVASVAVSPPLAGPERADAEAAARTLRQRLHILEARNENEIDAAFSALRHRHCATSPPLAD